MQPAYSSVVNHSAATGYGFCNSSPPFGANSDNQVDPPSFGRAQPTAALPQKLSHQKVQVHVTGSTASHELVIITQPVPVVRWPATYMGWSTFSFICCFWPLGLVAIMYSMKVVWAHNYVDAKRLSLTARNLNIAATASTLILVTIVLGILVNTAATNSVATNSAVSGSLYVLITYMNDPYYSRSYRY